jgi:hypothetical protein
MLVYHVFFWIPSVILPDLPPLVSVLVYIFVSEIVTYEIYLFGIGAGMEHQNTFLPLSNGGFPKVASSGCSQSVCWMLLPESVQQTGRFSRNPPHGVLVVTEM